MKPVALALAILLALALACSGGGKDEPMALNFGVVQSASGAAAIYGKSVNNGIELAVKQLESDELRITYTVLDDQSTVEGGKAAFSALTSQKVDAIIGPTLSGVALDAQKISQAAKIPALAATNTGEGITATGDHVFRIALAEEKVVPPVLAYVHRQTPIRRAVLVVDSSDAFSRSSAAAMKHGLAVIGATILREIDVANGTDYAGALAGLRGETFDAFLVTPLVDLAGPVVRTLRNQGFTQPVIGGNSFNTLDMVAKSGGAVSGAYVGASWNPAVSLAASQKFVADYTSAYGVAPDLYAAQGYASVQVLVAAAKRAGSVDAAALRDALAATSNLPTIFGQISMSEQREALYQPVVQQFRDDKLVVVQ